MVAELGAGMAFIAVFLAFTMIFAVIGLFVFLFIFWIYMIIDVAKRNFKEDSERVVWILVLVFLSWLGALIYYFAVKRDDKK
jgi:4-hydroxybenzoate polyprenyltransferase|tara:strand:- start:5 stop:250 length:246 start_codon:yes stop_codon:yes gene_type:complete